MRNPLRAKNFDPRFVPAALLALALVAWSEPSPRSLIAGAPVVVAGIALRSWAVGHLVKSERITVSGPYAHLRHPLYLGTLLIGLGLAAMLGGAAALCGAGGLSLWFALRYLPRKERVETARLLRRHGELYARYRAEVPALWPRLRRWQPAPEWRGRIESECPWRLARYDANNELGTAIAVAIAVFAIALRAAVA